MAVWTPAEVPHTSQWLCTNAMKATHYKDRPSLPVRRMAPGVELHQPVLVSGLRELGLGASVHLASTYDYS